MTKHGDQVRALAESPVVGARFKDFIARWEMNIEPPPVEKIEKYVLLYALNSDRILMSPPRPATPQRWGHTRLVDTAEEDYFNADDDDEEPIAIVSTPPPRGMLTGKRKRPPRTGIPVRAAPTKPPFNGLARAPPLGALVGDYGDGDGDSDDLDAGAGADENHRPTLGRASPIPGFAPMSYPVGSPAPSPSPSPAPSSPGAGPGEQPPASPRIAHRQVSSSAGARPPLGLGLSPADDADVLAELSRGAGALLPKISGLDGAAAAGSKRRRADDEDEDDELLERLANKAKRPAPAPAPASASAPAPAGGGGGNKPGPGGGGAPAKGAEEGQGPAQGPKKLKLKFGAVGAAVASASPVAKGSGASSPGTKDGDNG